MIAHPSSSSTPSGSEDVEPVAPPALGPAPAGPVPGRSDTDYEVLYAVGHSLYAQGRYHEASKVFFVLSVHTSLELRYIRALAASLQMMGNHEGAMQQYALWIMLDLDDPVPLLHTCECLIHMGRTDDALEALTALLEEYDLKGHSDIRKKAEGLIALIKRPA